MKLTAHPLAESLPGERDNGVAPIDQRLVFRLRSSLALLLTKGNRLSATFYELLFERCPAMRRMFPADIEDQSAKLMRTLTWIVTHLDRRDKTLPAVRELGSRHAGYGARREHYPFVRDTLLEAMRRTAGPDWNERLADDWRLSIDLIARHMLAAASAAPSPDAPTLAPATSTVPR